MFFYHVRGGTVCLSGDSGYVFVATKLLGVLLGRFEAARTRLSRILIRLGCSCAVLRGPATGVSTSVLKMCLRCVIGGANGSEVNLRAKFLLPFILANDFFGVFGRDGAIHSVFRGSTPFSPTVGSVCAFIAGRSSVGFFLRVSVRPRFRQLCPVTSER